MESPGATREIVVEEDLFVDGANIRIPEQRLAVTANGKLIALGWRCVV